MSKRGDFDVDGVIEQLMSIRDNPGKQVSVHFSRWDEIKTTTSPHWLKSQRFVTDCKLTLQEKTRDSDWHPWGHGIP